MTQVIFRNHLDFLLSKTSSLISKQSGNFQKIKCLQNFSYQASTCHRDSSLIELFDEWKGA